MCRQLHFEEQLGALEEGRRQAKQAFDNLLKRMKDVTRSTKWDDAKDMLMDKQEYKVVRLSICSVR